MKVVLSRKGFDSGYGKCPSPVFPDGTLLSMPIPVDTDEGTAFQDICYDGMTYMDIWQQLNPKAASAGKYCHLDPDIRKGIRATLPDNWQPAFGQTDAAQAHLQNQRVGIGDLFLFFGLFRQIIKQGGTLCFDRASQSRHILYGYLQIGEILQGEDIKKVYWHPHAASHYKNPRNTLYLPTKNLNLDGRRTSLPGTGVFRYDRELVLSKDGRTNRCWALPEFFRELTISYHSRESFQEDCFMSACKGQEFVISEDRRVTDWAESLITKHIDQRDL